ncbi:hypothetical protein UPYG_G00105070 [Umbra pygmaea]|uniref:Uncharacterized protein n=1 Tax=Umbra pygmaea TaxID=75934 RepID=A0ABD0X1N5_UMBPY
MTIMTVLKTFFCFVILLILSGSWGRETTKHFDCDTLRKGKFYEYCADVKEEPTCVEWEFRKSNSSIWLAEVCKNENMTKAQNVIHVNNSCITLPECVNITHIAISESKEDWNNFIVSGASGVFSIRNGCKQRVVSMNRQKDRKPGVVVKGGECSVHVQGLQDRHRLVNGRSEKHRSRLDGVGGVRKHDDKDIHSGSSGVCTQFLRLKAVKYASMSCDPVTPNQASMSFDPVTPNQASMTCDPVTPN